MTLRDWLSARVDHYISDGAETMTGEEWAEALDDGERETDTPITGGTALADPVCDYGTRCYRIGTDGYAIGAEPRFRVVA